MKILVTGGAGFIGSHIVDAYIARGHKVVIVDDLSTGHKANLNPKARFHRADIRDEAALARIMKLERPEVVNHHAALISVVESMREPLATYDTNVLGTAKVLLAFGQYGKPKKFIFASTGGALYGRVDKVPADEHTPVKPLSPYAASKAAAEVLIDFHAREFGFPYAILRYANVYGPRQNPKGEAGVVAIFSDLMPAGKVPKLFAKDSTRDYVFVADVAQANVRALTKGSNDAFNIGTGKETSNWEVFTTLARTIGFPHKPQVLPRRPGEVKRISLDARKAARVLGWKPRVDFKEGVRRTLVP